MHIYDFLDEGFCFFCGGFPFLHLMLAHFNFLSVYLPTLSICLTNDAGAIRLNNLNKRHKKFSLSDHENEHLLDKTVIVQIKCPRGLPQFTSDSFATILPFDGLKGDSNH